MTKHRRAFFGVLVSRRRERALHARVTVGSHTIEVTGRIVDGIVRIGTFYVLK